MTTRPLTESEMRRARIDQAERESLSRFPARPSYIPRDRTDPNRDDKQQQIDAHHEAIGYIEDQISGLLRRVRLLEEALGRVGRE